MNPAGRTYTLPCDTFEQFRAVPVVRSVVTARYPLVVSH